MTDTKFVLNKCRKHSTIHTTVEFAGKKGRLADCKAPADAFIQLGKYLVDVGEKMRVKESS